MSFDALFLTTYNQDCPSEEFFAQGWSWIDWARPPAERFLRNLRTLLQELRLLSMNRNFARLIPAMALAIILSVPALAQSAAPAASAPAITKVGIVNIQAAIVNSNEGQRDFETLQKKFDPKRTELENLNKEIDELQKKFNTQGDKLNDEARGDLLKQIDARKKTLQRNYEDANTDVQAQQNEIANRIGQKLVEVLDKYAKDNSYTLILDVSGQSSPVLWAANSVDITKAIVDAYNAQSGVAAPAKPATGVKPTVAPAKPGTAVKPTVAPATTPKK
jgi:outer membrane protein